MKLRFRKWVYGNISLRRSATEWSISLRKIRPLQVQNGHSAPKIFFISKTISLPYLEIWMSYVNILSTSHRSKIFHPAFWRSAPLYYFPTLLRGASQRYRTSPLRSLALRTAQINSHTAQILSTRANILWNRSLRPALFPTGALHRSNTFLLLIGALPRSIIFPPYSAELHAVIRFSYAFPRCQISLWPPHSRKIPPGVSLHRTPYKFHPWIEVKL